MHVYINISITRLFPLPIQVLAKTPLWNSFLLHFKNHQLIVEGPLSALRRSLVAIAKPTQKGGGRGGACANN